MATGPIRYEQKDGKVTWRVRWLYGGKREGARQQVAGLTFTDAKILKREVEARRHLIHAADPEVADRSIIRGRPTAAASATTSGMTWGAAGRAYIKSLDQQASSSRKMRETILRKTFAEWEHRPVEDLTQVDARALLQDLRQQSRSTASTHQFGTAVGRWLVSSGVIERSPFSGIKCDDTPFTKARFLTQGEIERLFAHLDREQDRLMVQTFLETGLRRGELMALAADDLSRVGSFWVLHVWHTVTLGSDGTGVKIGPVKTKKSDRKIAIPADLGDRLYSYIQEHGRRYIFVNRDGEFQSPVSFNKRFHEAVKAANLGTLRVHDLRHTHASRLLATRDVTLLTVSLRLGHVSTDFTSKTYGHGDPLQDEVVLAALVAARPGGAS